MVLTLRNALHALLLLGVCAGAGVLGGACGEGDAPLPTVPGARPPPGTQPQVPPPAVPANLRVSASGVDFVEWTWDAVEGVDEYHVESSENETFANAHEALRTPDQLSYRREGLEADARVYLRVRSVIYTGQNLVASEWSEPVAGMTAPPLPGLVVTPREFSLVEGETAELRVRLATQPTASVTVAVSVQALLEVYREPEMRPPLRISRGSRMTFEPEAWNAEQPAILVADHDFDSRDEQVAIYLDTTSEDPAYEHGPRRVVRGTVEDDDPHSLFLLVEGPFVGVYGPPESRTWNYVVFLGGMPTGEVVVEVISGDTGAVVVAEGSQLVFTPDDYREPQLFRLMGVAGRNFAGARMHLEASGGGYDGVRTEFLIERELRDETGIVLSDTELSLLEGSTGTFTVRPSLEPSNETHILVTSHNPSILTVVDGETEPNCLAGTCAGERSFRELMFSGDDWDEPQEVTLEAQPDDDAEDERVVVFFGVLEVDSHGNRYPSRISLTTATLLVTVDDHDPG